VKKYFQDKLPDLNMMAIPKITKVVINCGIGKMAKEKDAMEEIFKSIKEITGQSPVYAKAKKSISGFKSREGQEVGIVVTLRGERMWSFLERLISVALPRIRDFRGIDMKNFDNRGNLNLAVREQIVFPEIYPENVKNIFGFQITVVTTAKNKKEGVELLKALGFPLKNE
jgi:large subunit ribosomal protein L5